MYVKEKIRDKIIYLCKTDVFLCQKSLLSKIIKLTFYWWLWGTEQDTHSKARIPLLQGK